MHIYNHASTAFAYEREVPMALASNPRTLAMLRPHNKLRAIGPMQGKFVERSSLWIHTSI